jgi:protein phosphatase
MKMEGAGLRWSGHTDRGRVRANNEDSFLALRFDGRQFEYLGKIGESSIAQHDFAFAVSDGMGGAQAGEFASKISVEKITRLLPRAYRQGAEGLHGGFGDVLEEVFDQIHAALVNLGRSYAECQGMGATLTLCWFTPEWMYFGHIGDSRLYYLPAEGSGPGAFKQLTHDDTYVGWLFRQGKINEREARTHPGRHSLQKALGAGNQFVEPQVGSVGYQPGDRFLLCSDGVVDGMYDAALMDRLREPGVCAQGLVAEAVKASGRDNATAVIIECAREAGA